MTIFRNHLESTGDIDFKTNNSENFQKLSLKREKFERINRDSLKTAKEKFESDTTNKEYKVTQTFFLYFDIISVKNSRDLTPLRHPNYALLLLGM